MNILKKLRTASLLSKFTGSYIKKKNCTDRIDLFAKEYQKWANYFT